MSFSKGRNTFSISVSAALFTLILSWSEYLEAKTTASEKTTSEDESSATSEDDSSTNAQTGTVHISPPDAISATEETADDATPQEESDVAAPQEKSDVATPQEESDVATPQEKSDVATPQEEDRLSLGPQKGRWFFGGTVGAGYYGGENVQRFVFFYPESKGFSVSTQLLGGKILTKNIGVGLALRYDRNQAERIDESSGESKEHKSASQEYSVGVIVRQFLPIGDGPVAMFYQAGLGFGRTTAVQRMFAEDSSSVSTAEGWALSLSIQPGLAVFASEDFSVEVALDVLGISAQWDKTETDYDVKGRRASFDLNLDVNLLSLQFAFIGYF